MSKTELKIVTQGVQGGNLSQHKSQGWIKIVLNKKDFLYEDTIIIDAYQGIGRNYKQREELLICIEECDKRIFQGTKKELFDLIKLNWNKNENEKS